MFIKRLFILIFFLGLIYLIFIYLLFIYYLFLGKGCLADNKIRCPEGFIYYHLNPNSNSGQCIRQEIVQYAPFLTKIKI